MEGSNFALPPPKEKYSALMESSLNPQNFRVFMKSLVMATVSPAVLIYRLSTIDLLGNWKQERKIAKEFENSKFYNYGWPMSLREVWAGEAYERFFQSKDIDFFSKLVTENTLDLIYNVLKEKNIDTSKFGEAQTKIFNEGVIVKGDVTNSTLGGKSMKNSFINAAKKLTE